MVKIRESLVSSTRWGIKCPYLMTPTRIVVHNTANDASAAGEIQYMQSNDSQTSFHFAVDDKEAVLGIPLTRNAWHAGDGASGKGNREGIAVEICWSKSGGPKFTAAEKNAAELIAQLLKERGWGLDRVTKHQDYSGKYCPHRTLDLGWDRFLGMVKAAMTTAAPARADRYSHDGLTFVRCKNFKVVYHGDNKRKGQSKNYCNAGFFAVFADKSGKNFTLPVGNLVADFIAFPASAEQYLRPYASGGKVRIATAQNQSQQFRGKQVSTLVVPYSGSPYIGTMAYAPAGCKYAISGVPVIRGGADVSYAGAVTAEGWDGSCMYATYRNWLGVRGGEIWLITGKTVTSNYIATSEIYNKIAEEGFDDVIALDGGGSYYCRIDNKATTTAGTRVIDSIVEW